ncbi:MAG TPA: nucleotidyltransferase family protein [Casimicrobiaceae bacterium]|nr:nucleotidyltransferase family protein [Casimicrobiaceae bacterium]
MAAARPVVGLLLAAGSASRFGGDKLQATLPDGRPIAAAALAALAAAVDVVVAIVRPGAPALQSLLERSGATVVVCTDADAGMGASLACGVRAIARDHPDATGAVIALADMPWIAPATMREIAAALYRGAALAAPSHDGRRGHPVAIAARFFAELQALSGDEGAKNVLAAHAAEIELIAVDDPGVLRDVDTPADLAD